MKPYPWSRLRSARYDELYVSPHMDDAVYSCGGRIAQRRAEGARILVVTVFGNGRDDDQGSGVFGDIATRKREERAAMDLLDVDHLLLNHADLLVRPKRAADWARYVIPFAELGPNAFQQQLAASIAAIRWRFATPNARVFFPLAVGAHPDHRLVFEVGAAFAEEAFVWFYEDVPYAQVRALRDDRLHQLGLAPPALRLGAIGETHGFVMAQAPRWQLPLTFSAVAGHWLTMHAAARLRRGTATARAKDVRDISDVLERKLAAMRAYATQTAFFYPGAIEAKLPREGGRYVERSWQLSGLTSSLAPDALSVQREQALLEQLPRA
ncbi:MAG TPA: PIG-L family deacetylase [Polyangiales bacterium]|nr:PIG-L family deacetylase [Polyangiales bacterium]